MIWGFFWGGDFKEKKEENMIDRHFLYFHEEIISAIELFVRNKNLPLSELFWLPVVRPSVCKLFFIFSSHSLEPLGQFQLNIAQKIEGIELWSDEGTSPFSRRDNSKIEKKRWGV